MNGTLAQTASLTAHAKVRLLRDFEGNDQPYWDQHSTFKYLRSVRFEKTLRGFLGNPESWVVNSPCEWLKALPHDAEVSLISLSTSGILPPHIATAFVGGTREGIAVSNRKSVSLWVPTWEVVGKYPETNIWSVVYQCSTSNAPFGIRSPTIDEAKAHLDSTLRQVMQFAARDPSLSSWCGVFGKAQSLLNADDPIVPYHPDILPNIGYTHTAHQLLAASVGSFVFGGMGSWNDVGFLESTVQQEYDLLTTELYTAVMQGLITAINNGI